MCNNQPNFLTPDLLLQILQGETNGAVYYEQLASMAADSKDVEILQGIRQDELSHLAAFSSLYSQMTGTTPPPIQPNPAQIPSYIQGVKDAIQDELTDSQRYRCLYLGCNGTAPQLFFDAMSDENKHAALLSYLYTKQVEACCSETQEPEPPVCDGITHTVQPGEGLWVIGQTYAVSVEALLAANPQITDPGSIYAGQVICIPCAGTPYTVQPGDSLWLIARQYGLTVDALIASNPLITSPDAIHVGQVLCIPCTACGGGPAPVPTPKRESLTYLYGGTWSYYLEQLAQTQDSITTVCPDFFNIDESGNLLLAAANKLNTEFIDTLHGQGLKVTPFISNHWNRDLGAAAMSNREQLTTQLAAVVADYNLDGVNFDIENLPETYREAYIDITRLMREKLPADKIVSVAVAANPNGWTAGWHGSYDYNGLAANCNYLVIMAYDESFQGGPEGPVSSSSFFDRSIQYALNQGVSKNKIVVGIPFFGRYWREGAASGGIGIADRDVEYLLANYTATAAYNEETKSACATVIIREGDPLPQIWGGRVLSPGTYHIWYDNLMATRYKLETIAANNLLGAGSWALGQENPAIWNFYTEALNQSYPY